jgi:hypothetical protein
MERESISTLMGKGMRDNSKMGKRLASERCTIQAVTSIKVVGRTMRRMVLDSKSTLMGRSMWESGEMVKDLEQGSYSLTVKL